MDALLVSYRSHLLAAGRSHGTVQQRIAHIRRFARTYPMLLEVTTADLETFLAAESEAGRKPETRKALRSSMQAFYQWAHEDGRIPIDPSARLGAIRIPASVARRCPDSAVLAALEGATLRERAMILLGRYAALRLSEIATLHTEHFDGATLTITGKGGKTRSVPVAAELGETLMLLEQRQGPGFYFHGGTQGHMHPITVHKLIQRRLGWNPHSLRHAAATSAYKATRDLRSVQAFLGHSSIATTQRYLGVDMDEIRAVAEGTVIHAA